MSGAHIFDRGIFFGAALFCLLILPVLCFQKWRPGFQSPGARSGDEPHYLVTAHSIARDFDLDLTNNYAPVRFRDSHRTLRVDTPAELQAKLQATRYSQGVYLSGFPLSRHTNLVPPGLTNPAPAAAIDTNNTTEATGASDPGTRIYRWDEVYDIVPAPGVDPYRSTLPMHERFVAERRPAFADYRCETCDEVVWHPLGYPVLLAIIAYPFLAFGSYWSEFWIVVLQFALYTYALLQIRALVPLRSPASNAAESSLRDLPWLLATAVGLSAYYFAACIYTEGVAPALLLLAIAAFARGRPLQVSAFLGLLFFIKESYAPLGPIFAAAYWLEHRRPRDLRVLRDLFVMAIFPVLAFALFLLRNQIFYGAPLSTYYPWASNPDILEGMGGLLFSAKKGVFVFTPVFLFFLLGLWPLARRRPYVALAAGGTFAYFFLLTSATAYWSGGPTYGYRLLTPAAAALTPAFFAWIAWIRRPDAATAPDSANSNANANANGQIDTVRPRLTRLARRGAFALTIALLGVSAINGFFGATNLDYAFDTETYVNLIDPEYSHLYRRFFGEP
ncbi:MAG: hypothetical protein NXI24_04070 [bacterium]|nr:hypothetical protein [bacterium]